MFGETKVVNLCLSDRCGHRCIFCGDVRGKLRADRGAMSASREGVFRAYVDERGWEEFVPLP